MLVLPLGLGTKLRRVPIVTITVACLWLIVAILDRSSDRITSRLLDVVATSGVRDASRDLFVQYCQSRHGQAKGCKKYAVLIWTGAPGRGQRHPAEASRLIADNKKAEKAQEELSDCGRSRTCFSYKTILSSYLNTELPHPRALRHLKGYRAYKQAVSAYRQGLKRLCIVNDCLVKGNITLRSLLLAQVRHGGAMHLFGNLFAFLIFGIYVEQRTSRALYAAVVVLGGTLGMAIHTAFFGSSDTISLGGSANVSAVMGMFYVFFFHARMRFLVWLPRKLYYGSTFFADVRFCFPLLFVLSDITGGLSHSVSDLLDAKVAHFAHLTGLIFGMLVALAVVAWRRLPRPFIYEGEVDDMGELERCRDVGRSLVLAQQMASYNPENVHALEVAAGAFVRWTHVASVNEHAGLHDRGRAFLRQHLQTICAVNARHGEMRYAGKLLSQMPMYLPYGDYLGRLGQVSTLKLADYALSEGHPVLACRLYDFFLTRFPLSVKCKAIDDTAAELITSLTPSRENVQAMTLFVQYHPESQLAPRIGAWVSNVSARRA